MNNSKDHWNNMPEFKQENKEAFKRVSISFENQEDLDSFNKITGLSITQKTKGVFYPKKENPKVKFVKEDGD